MRSPALSLFALSASMVACESFSSTTDSSATADASTADASEDASTITSDAGNDVANGDAASGDAATASPCASATSNMAVLDGEVGDYVHPGLTTFTSASASYLAQVLPNPTATPSHVAITVSAKNVNEGSWRFEFANDSPLAVGSYPNASRAGVGGIPGLEVTGNGKGCNAIAGSFAITAITATSGGITSFTATFTQRCDASTGVLRGCVHYQE